MWSCDAPLCEKRERDIRTCEDYVVKEIIYLNPEELSFRILKMTDYTAKAKELIANNKYLMLSKTWCPDCQYAYSIFDKFGVKGKVHIIELDKFEDQTEADNLQSGFTEIVGRKWVPSIFFNGEVFDESDLKKMVASEELEQFFRKHGII